MNLLKYALQFFFITFLYVEINLWSCSPGLPHWKLACEAQALNKLQKYNTVNLHPLHPLPCTKSIVKWDPHSFHHSDNQCMKALLSTLHTTVLVYLTIFQRNWGPLTSTLQRVNNPARRRGWFGLKFVAYQSGIWNCVSYTSGLFCWPLGCETPAWKPLPKYNTFNPILTMVGVH